MCLSIFLSRCNAWPRRRHTTFGSRRCRPRNVQSRAKQVSIDSPCGCEHNNPDSLDARLFPSVVLAVTPAVPMDEAYSLSVSIYIPIYLCVCLSICLSVCLSKCNVLPRRRHTTFGSRRCRPRNVQSRAKQVSTHLHICLSICLSIFLSRCNAWPRQRHTTFGSRRCRLRNAQSRARQVFILLSICLSKCLSIFLSVYVSIFLCKFNPLPRPRHTTFELRLWWPPNAQSRAKQVSTHLSICLLVCLYICICVSITCSLKERNADVT